MIEIDTEREINTLDRERKRDIERESEGEITWKQEASLGFKAPYPFVR